MSPSRQINFRDYVYSLLATVYRAIRGTEVAFVATVEHVGMNTATAIACGLMLNELISDSLRQATRGGNSVTIRIQLSVSDGRMCRLSVGDSRRQVPSIRESAGGESQLLPALVKELGGWIEQQDGNGHRVTVIFPIEPQQLEARY